MTWKQNLLTGLLASTALTGCMAGPAEEPGPTDAAQGIDGSGEAAGSDFTGGASLTGEVTGTRLLRYRTDIGDFSEPISPATSPIQAFVVENGARRYLTLSDPGNGTFRILDAPVGSYFLQSGTFYVSTDSRTLSMDRYELGRRGRVTSSTQPLVKLTLGNLSPLRNGESLHLEAVSSNAGVLADLYSYDGATADNTTSVTNFEAPWADIYGSTATGIVDGTKGDFVYLNQTVDRSAGPLTYTSIERTLAVPPFTLSTNAAAPTTLSGTLQAVPQRTARIEWWRSRFDVWRLAVHPQATPTSGTVSISPLAWGNDAWYGYVGDLVYGFLPGSAQDLDLRLDYGNPFLSWGTAVHLSHRYSLPLRLPGTTSGTLTLTLSDTQVLKEVMAPIAPRISPPQGLLVDGANAQVDRTLASLTPTLSWSAPRVGTPSAYRVRVYRLYTLASTPTVTRYSTVATFHTATPSVKLPPGVLLANERYAVMVWAHLMPGVDFARQPNVIEVQVDTAYAMTSSSILTAPASLTREPTAEATPEPEEAPEQEYGRLRFHPKGAHAL